ncbi:hypothetical protein JTB14_011626 [Gonioctena quinquepunctata]|nr:hypothetical protein JTB14_011626 [Gonioctena quinquepunctata]
MPIILVIVPGSEIRIKKQTTICDMEVIFEYKRKKKRIGQCYNCQRFGHSAQNCGTVQANMKPEHIPKIKRAPISAATVRGLINLIIEVALIFQV